MWRKFNVLVNSAVGLSSRVTVGGRMKDAGWWSDKRK